MLKVIFIYEFNYFFLSVLSVNFSSSHNYGAPIIVTKRYIQTAAAVTVPDATATRDPLLSSIFLSPTIERKHISGTIIPVGPNTKTETTVSTRKNNFAIIVVLYKTKGAD